MLAAGAGGAAGLHLDVLGPDLHLDVVGQLRHDLHRGKGGLPPGVGVKGGHPHQPVHAVLAPQKAVGVLPLDGDGGGLDARLVALFIVEGGALEVVTLGPAGVHPEEHLRPVLGLGAAGAGVEGEDGAVGIILPGEQGLQAGLLDLGLQLCVFRLNLGQDLLVLGLLAHLAEGHQVLPGGDELVLPLDLVLQLLEAHLHLLGPGQVVPEPVLGGLLLQPRGLLLGALNVQGGGELGELRLQGVQLLFIGVVFDHSHGIVSPFPSVSRGMPGAGRQRPGGRPRNAGGLGPSLQYPLLYKTLPAFVKGKSAFWEEMWRLSLSAKELISSDALIFLRRNGGEAMKYECLKLEERRIIEEMYAKGAKPGEIAERVGKCQATIYRELERGKTGETDSRFRQGYSAEVAEARVNRSYRNRGRRKAAQ